MGCGCKKTPLEKVTALAQAFVTLEKIDVQVYSTKLPTGELSYNFEPLNPSRENILFYIPYRDFSHTGL